MKAERKKVLEIAGGFRENINGMPVSGGVAAMLSNYCAKADKEKLTFDFLALKNQCFEQYRDELEANGWNLYCLDLQENGLKRMVRLIWRLSIFVRRQRYDVVHINIGSFFPVLFCAAASRIGGARIIVAHSHSTGIYSPRKRFMADMCKPLLTIFATDYCACSKKAAENLFSKRVIQNEKYKIVRNAIESEKFKFNPLVRKEIRMELGIGDELVIGHVGRFVDAKNHAFLLDIFSEIKKKMPHTKLLLVGDGQLRSEIEAKADGLGIYNDVIFTGQRKDTHKYYWAMDVFVMPSLYEGFPIVSLEAQCAGLPCYVSDTVPDEVNISDLYRSFSLKKGHRDIAVQIIRDIEHFSNRKDMSETVRRNGYELQDNVRLFEELYE